MLRPMIPLTLNVAILDGHTRLTRLETNALFYATIGATDVNLVHPGEIWAGTQPLRARKSMARGVRTT